MTHTKYFIRTMIVVLFVLIAVVGSTPKVIRAASTWYVAPSGNDSNSCDSPGSPCETINAAIGKANPGDLIQVSEGAYMGENDSVVRVDKDIQLSGGWDSTFTSRVGLSIVDGQNVRKGIQVDSVVTLIEYFQIQNGSASYGGGIYNTGMLTLQNCVIDHNKNLAIMNEQYGTLNLTNSSVHSNLGGGLWNIGGATLNNSTISDNHGGPPWFDVGGINNNGNILINSSTITDNSSNDGGGIFNFGGSNATLRNSILSGNSAHHAPDCSGAIFSEGYNLVGDLSGCVYNSVQGDQIGVDPRLTALLGKPGTPLYHALLPDSPGVDAGNPDGCLGNDGVLDSDQRGAGRVNRCDIGAYEYTFPGAAAIFYTFAGSLQHSPPGTVFPQNLQAVVLDDLGTPVDQASITFSAPSSGPSGTFADSGTNNTTVASQLDGMATAPDFTSNGLRGSYLVTATLPAVGATVFSLGNFAWYVKPTGLDTNDCQSPATACATIPAPMLKPEYIPGEKVYVAAGLYTGSGDQVLLLNQSVYLSGGWNPGFTLQEGYSIVDGQKQRLGIDIAWYVPVWMERFEVRNGWTDSMLMNGGGILNDGDLSLINCKIRQNNGYYGSGIYNTGTLTLEDCTVTENTNGAALMSWYGQMTIKDSLISNKQASSGINSSSAIVEVDHCVVRDHLERGITTEGGLLTVQNSLIANNQAIGINNGGELHLSNSVVRDNGGNGINGAYGSSLFLDNCTIANNGPAEDGGGVAGFGVISNCTVSGNQAMNGGGIAGEFSLQNTLVADNIADFGPDITGTYHSNGYNLIEYTIGSNFTPIAGDIVGVDPMLGVFETTPGVFPIPPESPAVDGGNPGGCTNNEGVLLETDLRSLPRFGNCDIGSYELQPLGFSTLKANRNEVYPGEPVDFTIFVRNPGQASYPEVQVSNSIPEDLEFVEGTLVASRGEANYNAGVISWAGAIADEDEVTIRYSSLVKRDIPTRSVIINTVEISSVEEGYWRSLNINIPPYRLFSSCVNRACLRSVSDDFSDPNSGWPVQDNGRNRYEYLNGEYRILIRPEWGGAGVRSDFYPKDFSARVDVRNTTGGQGSYGLLFGLIDNWDSFYTFEIYPEGYFAVYRFSVNDVVILAEGFSPAIRQGTAPNRLGVERSGASIKIYANGQLLAELSDGTYTGYGYIGFIVFSYNQSNLDIFFDNFNAVSPRCLPSASESVTIILQSDMEVPSRHSLPLQK